MSLLSDIGTAIKNKLGGTSVDNTVPRYDGTTCKLQGSGVTISDTNVVTASGGFVGNLTGNASTATLASDSNKLIGKNWAWAGQSGQPAWVWGGSDGVNMYVWNPANFSVAYANNAGNASTATTLTTFVAGGLTEVGRYFDFHGSTADSDYDVRLDAGVTGTTGGGTLTITAGGGLVCSGNVTAYSDSRLKENIETIDNALEKTLNMRGVYYNRIDDEKKRRKLGVIAQEVQAIIPEVVLTNEETGTLSVDYGNIVGLLIEAIKEQQKQIDELTALVKGA